jgi:hypothetical protein
MMSSYLNLQHNQREAEEEKEEESKSKNWGVNTTKLPRISMNLEELHNNHLMCTEISHTFTPRRILEN